MTTLVVTALFCLAPVACSPSTGPSATVAFENVMVIDATGAAPASAMTVTTADGRIPSIEPSARARVPATAHRLDARPHRARRVDYIKTHAATPRDAYFALLSESRLVGLKVTGHVPFAVTPEEAIAAGQHSIEHIVSLFEGPVARIVQTRA
jgi:hypothetical protein